MSITRRAFCQGSGALALATLVLASSASLLSLTRAAFAQSVSPVELLTPGPLGDERGDACRQVALTLLAAECAAHAPHLDRDTVARNVQHMCSFVLDFAGVLGRGMDEHFVILDFFF